MRTYHIHITGQVQGVGFRPFVYRLARTLNLLGSVKNGVDGVHILIYGTDEEIDTFIRRIHSDCPVQARIERQDLRELEHHSFDDFRIIDSDPVGKKEVRLSPDFGLCTDCIDDLNERENRRYCYPFTTCTNCGPRFSIIDGLPYDRATTRMADFEMCPTCNQEYMDPGDRRFYSQTSSCPECAINLALVIQGQPEKNHDTSELIEEVVDLLNEGKVGAVKGIGGYLLMCDATNTQAIQNLRERKRRPHKPFAIMYPDLDQIKEDLICDETAGTWLSGPRRRSSCCQRGIAQKAELPTMQ